MKNFKLDLFKTFLAVILFCFLILFYNYSKNGRYISHNINLILDTKTGEVYLYDVESGKLKLIHDVYLEKNKKNNE